MDRTKYIEQKIKMGLEVVSKLRTPKKIKTDKELLFSIKSTMNDDRTYQTFTNLEKKLKNEYSLVFFQFFKKHQITINNEVALTVWLSELLDIVNNNKIPIDLLQKMIVKEVLDIELDN